MSTPSPEKDSLLGPTVHKKIEYQNLKGDVFFAGPFNNCLISYFILNVFQLLCGHMEILPGNFLTFPRFTSVCSALCHGYAANQFKKCP